jgi:sulfur relay (sulfurtransferase) DsrC/TusE family protein
MNKLTTGQTTSSEGIEVIRFIENFYKKNKKFPTKEEIYKRLMIKK